MKYVKYLMIAVCVITLVWAVLNRLFLTKVDPDAARSSNLEVPKDRIKKL